MSAGREAERDLALAAVVRLAHRANDDVVVVVVNMSSSGVIDLAAGSHHSATSS